jgi:anti-sigma regulatory factor (Ser/Thr protein kinase)
VQSAMLLMDVCDATESNQIAIALHEALQNAVEHGNLELDSNLRSSDLSAYCQMTRERAQTAPYCDRRVHVRAVVDRHEARVVLRDEGPGFEPADLADALDPENLDKLSGRGILLMRTFMDEVDYNEQGNEVTLVKRRRRPSVETA